ncbi:hypothetical protein AAC387_Pa05g3298 [Persea americana]
MQFEWQPYKKLGKPFFRLVPKADRELVTSSAPLIFYWLLERHNTGRLIKQFGLRQVVPPPFVLPFPRAERKQRVIVDYSQKNKAKIKMREDRCRYILRAKKSSSGLHADEDMVWYSLNTIMLVRRIREPDSHLPMDLEHAEEHEPSIPHRRASYHVYPLALFR